MTCVSDGNVTVCYGPPMREHTREQHGEERWCFRCRKRRTFELVVSVPTGISYYDPHSWIECGTCHLTDGDVFPGRIREWVEE